MEVDGEDEEDEDEDEDEGGGDEEKRTGGPVSPPSAMTSSQYRVRFLEMQNKKNYKNIETVKLRVNQKPLPKKKPA